MKWEDYPLMLTTRQAQEILNVSQPHIYHLLESGDIPRVRLGGTYRIPRELLRQTLEGGASSQ